MKNWNADIVWQFKKIMRILKISYEYPPIGGGGSRVVSGLAGELVRLGHEVDLVTMKFGDLPVFESIEGVNVHRVPCLRLDRSICRPPEMATYLINARKYVRKILSEKQFDINHTHFIFPDGLLSSWIKRESGLPFIVTAHGSDVPGYNPNRFKFLHKVLHPVWRNVVESSAGITSPSHTLAGLIKVQDVDKQVEVIPNGITPIKYDLRNRSARRALVVSRFFERKGIQYFLEILQLICC